MMYDATNWYWIVGGSTTQVYSSARAQYVSSSDPVYAAWLAAGGAAIPIASDAALVAYLMVAYPPGHPHAAAMVQAQVLLDAANVSMARVAEGITLGTCVATNADVVAFVTWIRAVRAIRTSGVVPSGGWPTKPAYPVGS